MSLAGHGLGKRWPVHDTIEAKLRAVEAHHLVEAFTAPEKHNSKVFAFSTSQVQLLITEALAVAS